MSAMELLRSRVAESAKAASAAARQLSALDDMAQNDDYIQSEGLRVSEKKDTSAAPSYSDNASSVVEDLSGRFVDALSTAARKQTRPRPVNEQISPTMAEHLERQPPRVEHQKIKAREDNKPPKPKKVTQQSTQKTKLISSVAELYDSKDKQRAVQQQPATRDIRQKQPLMQKKKGKDNKPSTTKSDQSSLSVATVPTSPGQKSKVLLVNDHAHILHELDYDSDTSSDVEEKAEGSQQSGDLEMGGVGNADQLEQELEESISRQNSLNGPPNGDKQKDVHRFMKMTADMESERESLLSSLQPAPEPTPTNASRVESMNAPWAQNTPGVSAGEETNKALRAGLSWMRNVASPQLEAFSKQIINSVSEADFRKSPAEQRPAKGPMIGPRRTPTAKNDAEEEKITMTSSAAFLADVDMAELERIRMRNSPSTIRALLQACSDNPRLAFIAVTLVFALFAYFYSRHRSVDDVL